MKEKTALEIERERENISRNNAMLEIVHVLSNNPAGVFSWLIIVTWLTCSSGRIFSNILVAVLDC